MMDEEKRPTQFATVYVILGGVYTEMSDGKIVAKGEPVRKKYEDALALGKEKPASKKDGK